MSYSIMKICNDSIKLIFSFLCRRFKPFKQFEKGCRCLNQDTGSQHLTKTLNFTSLEQLNEHDNREMLVIFQCFNTIWSHVCNVNNFEENWKSSQQCDHITLNEALVDCFSQYYILVFLFITVYEVSTCFLLGFGLILWENYTCLGTFTQLLLSNFLKNRKNCHATTV